MENSMLICGTRGSFPCTDKQFEKYGFDTTCYAIKYNNIGIIIDCGTGLKKVCHFLKDCNEIYILFTHFHYDHIMGLLSLPTSFFKGKTATIFGYSENPLQSVFEDFLKPPFWPFFPLPDDITYTNILPDMQYDLNEFLTIQTTTNNHPDDGLLYRLFLNNKSFSFIFDYEHTNGNSSIINFARNSDYLIYDGMFDDGNFISHVGWGHSTWQKGIKLAKDTYSKNLIISHHAPTSNDSILELRENSAKKMFKDCIFAKEGDNIPI